MVPALPPFPPPNPSPLTPDTSPMTYQLHAALAHGASGEKHATLGRYQAYLQSFRSLTSTVVRRMSDDALQDCAHRLGTASSGQLVGFAQLEWPVLLDFALYCHRLAGESAVQRLRAEERPVQTVADQVLDAMCATSIRILDLERVSEGIGFRGVDVWTGEDIGIIEPGIAKRFTEGDRVVCRIVDLSDLSMTTELILPLSDAGLFRLVDELDASDVDPRELLTPQALDEYARVVYRCALDDQS